MDYRGAINYLESLPTPEVWTLERPMQLARLANVKFEYEIMHVAGTNGKGSVCAFMASILREAGFKVGLYTSPHLVNYNERVQVNGKQISDEEFAEMIQKIRPHIEKMRKDGKTPSQFEVLTIAAFKFLDSQEPDFLVLETGMGGRLDATNIAPSRIQAITSISFDHTKNLGNTLAKIASEKAGIIKRGSLVSISSTSDEARDVFLQKCASTGSHASLIGTDYSFSSANESLRGGVFDFDGRILHLKRLRISLLGKHQFENASCALSVIESLLQLGYPIPEAAIRTGLLNARWPGRLELIRSKPPILLDGAHNPDGMLKLKAVLTELFAGKITLVLGIMADKEYAKMLKIIAPVASKIILTRASIERSATPEMLRTVFKTNAGQKILVANNISDAIALAKRETPPNGLICLTGSLYLIGEAQALFKLK